MSLSYLGFHAVFLCPPILVLGWLTYRRVGLSQTRRRWRRRVGTGLAIIVALAVVYTTPWTNLLIPRGVWWYGEGVVRGTIWHTPLEEYLFFVLQPILTALVLVLVGFRLSASDRSSRVELRLPRRHRIAGATAGLAVTVVGWALLGPGSTETYYLGALLLWAGPILALQWAVGATYLWANRRLVALAIGLPTLYLWLADRIALERGLWHISETHTTGYALAGLPLEEALFFLVTNAFVVQGIVLYAWVVERADELPSLVDLRRMGRRSSWLAQKVQREREPEPEPELEPEPNPDADLTDAP
ncbi:lycopene cyclase domain-containing protein [Halopiger xanaduensis]|uniref:Lycopene cyclase domain protein n=1 Tax=Halopiger xanaduensis (strain DSM 18323 / JCM 14033 / SH-6) TaxID=797210 RepID=F8D7E2_HALXS|nr:lycopene cyclase domain-containing protein [Halopiger xanaduensis]AEH37862.1 lycopene cyclase domain protein [Halopiger xanaduensis SH-6]